MGKWLAGILAGVLIGIILWFLTEKIFPDLSRFPVSEVSINQFDKSRKIVFGKAILSSDKQFSVLVFAGKAGGPHWLQGASGSLFSEIERKQVGTQWQVSWTVPEIYVGDEIAEIHAVAVLPGDVKKFIAAGTLDPLSGNAIKVGNITSFPEPKRISVAFDPTKNDPKTGPPEPHPSLTLSPEVTDEAGRPINVREAPFKIRVKGTAADVERYYVYIIVDDSNAQWVAPTPELGPNIKREFSGYCYLGEEKAQDSIGKLYKVFAVATNREHRQYEKLDRRTLLAESSIIELLRVK